MIIVIIRIKVCRFIYINTEYSDEDASGNAISGRSNHGIYAFAEGRVYSEAASPEQGLDMFIRYGIADKRINTVGSYLGLGVNYTGPIPERDEDVFGVAVAHARASDDYIDTQRALLADPTHAETIVELTYQIPVTDWLTVQPDIQWVHNPGFDKTIDDATVIGMRVEVAF
ncbi:carbohydrate porin [Sulfuriflexus mobilis]|uniref:carbohydrate porin n=1 Tax=Sulfuriflexus mobilis TaxID=1811807 RepID=UPI00155935A8|nr:carbohydrate porin [Sulfuriflexus mobilis]